MSEISVSVILLTYNHSKFIEQAARSVLAQRSDDLPGAIEIIVGEDCSKDNTPDLLRKLDQEFPGRMTLLLRSQNLGLSKNLEDCWQRCRGKYIAILEGDDFWSDPNKLIKVVKHLDCHPDQSGCWHAYHLESTVKSVPSGELPNPFPASPLNVHDLLQYNHLRSYSLICYRRGIVPKFPVGHRRLASGDWLLNLIHAAHGPFGFIPEVMATYRMHPGGMIATLDPGKLTIEPIEVMLNFDFETQGRYHEEVVQILNRRQKDLSKELTWLRKISDRYHAMRLDKAAAWMKWLLSPFRKA